MGKRICWRRLSPPLYPPSLPSPCSLSLPLYIQSMLSTPHLPSLTHYQAAVVTKVTGFLCAKIATQFISLQCINETQIMSGIYCYIQPRYCYTLICFTCPCDCLHPHPGVAHLPHYPLCIYTRVLCLSIASSSCLSSQPAFLFSAPALPSLSLSRPPGFDPCLSCL